MNITHRIFFAIPTMVSYSIFIDSNGPQLSSAGRTFVAAIIEHTTPVDLCIVPARRNMMHLFPAIGSRTILISEALGILLWCLKRIRGKLAVTSEEASKIAVAVIQENFYRGRNCIEIIFSTQKAFMSLIMQLILSCNRFTFFVRFESRGDTRHCFNCNDIRGIGSPGGKIV